MEDQATANNTESNMHGHLLMLKHKKVEMNPNKQPHYGIKHLWPILLEYPTMMIRKIQPSLYPLLPRFRQGLASKLSVYSTLKVLLNGTLVDIWYIS